MRLPPLLDSAKAAAPVGLNGFDLCEGEIVVALRELAGVGCLACRKSRFHVSL
jgi:hypothetical protein